MPFMLTTLAAVAGCQLVQALVLWYRRRRGLGPWPVVSRKILPKLMISMAFATAIGTIGFLGWATGWLPDFLWMLLYGTGAIQLGAVFAALQALAQSAPEDQ